MNIHEHQAKEILKKFGINVPNGIVVFSLEEIDQKFKIFSYDVGVEFSLNFAV